jgi:hypothetical protein
MSRHRFDHAAAKAFWISLDPGQRSNPIVAEKFGITETTVRKWRKLEHWDDAAHAADASAAAALERQAVKTREQRALQDARIRDRAAQRVQDRLEAADVGDDWIRQVLADADKRVRLNEVPGVARRGSAARRGPGRAGPRAQRARPCLPGRAAGTGAGAAGPDRR